MAKVRKVTLLLNELVVDRQQYKPYTARLASPLEAPVYVEILVPEEGVVGEGPLVLSLEGLTAVMNNVATAIDNMHNAYLKSFMTPSQKIK
jgi:hypothetical protein